MAKPKVKLVSPGVGNLLTDSGVQSDMQARGERVLAAARAGCPVESGDLQASLRVEVLTEDRVVVQVGSDLGYALSVAAGTGFLQQALDAGR